MSMGLGMTPSAPAAAYTTRSSGLLFPDVMRMGMGGRPVSRSNRRTRSHASLPFIRFMFCCGVGFRNVPCRGVGAGHEGASSGNSQCMRVAPSVRLPY